MNPGKYTLWGALIGVLLAIAAATGGFAGLLGAIVLGAVGTAIGAHYDGIVDLTALRRSRS